MFTDGLIVIENNTARTSTVTPDDFVANEFYDPKTIGTGYGVSTN